MKKTLVLAFLSIFVLSFSACSRDSIDDTNDNTATSSVNSIVQILENEGYNLTVHDNDSKTYFSENTVANLGLDMDVTDLIMGTLNDSNWVEIIGLETEADAIALKNAFAAEENEGQLLYQLGNTVVLTYSQAVIDLLE